MCGASKILQVDARRSLTGKYTGWLTKGKSDVARHRWFASATKRVFTIDYDRQVIFYAKSETGKQTSDTIGFSAVLGAAMCQDEAAHSMGVGFFLRTVDREFRLFAESKLEAALWVLGFNGAKDTKSCPQRPVCNEQTSQSIAPSSADFGVSTVPPFGKRPSTPDAGPSGLTVGHQGAAASGQAPPMPPTQLAPGALSLALQVHEMDDAFASLDALEELAGPAPTQVCNFDRIRAEVPNSLLRDARMIVSAGVSRSSLRSSSVPTEDPHEATARASADALLRHNPKADMWDSSDDEDDEVMNNVPVLRSAAIDAVTRHNLAAESWDSDDDEEPAATAMMQDAARESGDAMTPDDRTVRREARKAARREAGETAEEREARRMSRKERKAKKCAEPRPENMAAASVGGA